MDSNFKINLRKIKPSRPSELEKSDYRKTSISLYKSLLNKYAGNSRHGDLEIHVSKHNEATLTTKSDVSFFEGILMVVYSDLNKQITKEISNGIIRFILSWLIPNEKNKGKIEAPDGVYLKVTMSSDKKIAELKSSDHADIDKVIGVMERMLSDDDPTLTITPEIEKESDI